MVFIVNQILILIESIICSNMKKYGRKIFLLVTFTQMFVLLGFRSFDVGTDTQTYIATFRAAKLGFNIDQFEVLNRIVMKVLANMPNAEIIYLALYAFVTLACFFYFIKNNSEDVYLSVSIFSGLMFYYLCFNLMRQVLAMAIVSVAITKLNKGKKGAFFILVLIAIGFHTSAMVAVLIWLVKKINIKYTWSIYFGCVLASMAMLVLGRKIVEMFLTFFPMYRIYINSIFADDGNYLNPIMYLGILTIVTIIWGRFRRNEKDDLCLIMLGIGTILYFISLDVGIVNRIVYYYTMSVIVVLPNLLKRISRIRNRVPLSVGAHLMVFIYSCLLVARGAHGIVPYKFFWQ